METDVLGSREKGSMNARGEKQRNICRKPRG